MPEFNNLLEAEAAAAGKEFDPEVLAKLDPIPLFEEQEVLPIEPSEITLDPQPVFDGGQPSVDDSTSE